MSNKKNVAYCIRIPALLTRIWNNTLWKYSRTSCPATANSNRVIIITGCDSGVGLELARQVASWDYHLVAGCLSLESRGANLLKLRSVDVVEVNVCRRDSVEMLVRKIKKLEEEEKEIWCLVNNAGIMTFAQTEWLTWDLTETQLLVNISGTIQVTRSLLPFIRHCKGRIINVSSPQALIASPNMSVYCASKWGVEAFSQSLRREVSSYGVKVIVVRPCNIPHKTSILSQNEKHLRTMLAEMSKESAEEFGNEIEKMRMNFKMGFSDNDAPEELHDHKLMESFRSAIESPTPYRSYDAAPFIVKVFLWFIQLLPVSMVDYLVTWDIHTSVINWGKID